MDTLVLNRNYLPLDIITWKDAICLEIKQKVRVLHRHEDWVVRSPSVNMAVPSVVVIKRYVDPSKRVPFSKKNIYRRDNYECQYCGSSKALTFDHVIPRSRGGPTNWSNIVASCLPCNTEKGDKTPEEAGMTLKKKPKHPLLSNPVRYKMGSKRIPKDWDFYLIG